MTDQIGVQIVAADSQFIAATKATASAMAAVAAQEERLGKAAKDAGLDQKKFSSLYRQLEKQKQAQQAKGAKDVLSAQSKNQRAQAIQKAKETKDQKAAAATRAKEQAALLKSDKEALGTAKDLAKEFLGVGVAVGVAAVALGVLAFKANEAKNNTKGILDVLTAGRGDKALWLVDDMAVKLGVDIGDTRDKFLEFRRAGLDNKKSAQLIKLAADLNTVDKSGSLAKEAISRVLSFTGNGTQTKLQAEAAAKTMALLAKQAHVAGDGTKAASENAKTLTGALARIGNVKTKSLEAIGEKIAPSIDRAASAVATFVEKLAGSKEGAELLQDVTDVLEKVSVALDKVAKADSSIKAVRDGFHEVKDACDEVYSILGDVGSAFEEVGLAAFEIPKAFWIVGNNIVDAVSFTGKALYNLPGNVKDFVVTPIANMGPDIVNGLVSGLESGAARLVKSVTGLASKAKAAFKDALGIHSPSKVFAGYGVNIGVGLNKGLDRSMPEGREMAARMLPAPETMASAQSSFMAPRPIFAPPAAAAPAASSAPSVVINLHGGATDDDAKRVRNEIELWWTSKQQQQGLR